MSINFSSHRGTAELDQYIEQAIKENNPSQIFDLVEQLAALPDARYEKYKIQFKDAFKRRLSITGLDKAVREARKDLKRAKILARQLPAPAPAPGQARPRPVVETTGQLRDVTRAALNALELWNKDEPTIFVQSGRLVAIRFSEKGGPSVEPLTLSPLRHMMTESADYLRISEGADAIPEKPPIDVVRDILEGITNAADYPFPSLAGITELPILRPDGSIHQTPGYDPVTEQVYLPGELVIPPIPEKPSPDEVYQSVALFDHMLADFPFADKASKATIVANIVTVVGRSLIKKTVPLTLLDAPKQGSGKTLLALIVGIIATGRILSTNSPTSDDEEWRKRILTWLLSSPSVIIIDNIIHQLESSNLCSAITSGYVEDRLLATNTKVQVENRAVWFATGNNIRVGEDMTRRCIMCKLDAKSERPWKRDQEKFRIKDIQEWTLEHRAEIVAAALTLIRNWYAQECPKPTCTLLGNFEEWCRIVGGILQSAGIPDFLANLDDENGNSSIDENTAAWKAFIRAIHDVYGSNAFTFSALAKRMLEKDEQAENLCETLPPALTKSFGSYQKSQGADPDFATHMGHSFRVKKGQVFDELRLEIAGKDRTGKAKWQIVLNDDSTSTMPDSDSISAPAPAPAPETQQQEDTANLPAEIVTLYREYVQHLKLQNERMGEEFEIMWRAPDQGYANQMLKPRDHQQQTKRMLTSGNSKERNAAVEAMNRTLNRTSGR